MFTNKNVLLVYCVCFIIIIIWSWSGMMMILLVVVCYVMRIQEKWKQREFRVTPFGYTIGINILRKETLKTTIPIDFFVWKDSFQPQFMIIRDIISHYPISCHIINLQTVRFCYTYVVHCPIKVERTMVTYNVHVDCRRMSEKKDVCVPKSDTILLALVTLFVRHYT